MKKQGTKVQKVPVRRGVALVFACAAVLALAGLADATYLTVQHLTGATAACGESTGCFEVLGSKYAHVGPMPVAGLGAIAYFLAFSFATFAAFGSARSRQFLSITVGALFVATLGLLALQAFVLHAFCRYCLFSAAVTFLLTGIVVSLRPAD